MGREEDDAAALGANEISRKKFLARKHKNELGQWAEVTEALMENLLGSQWQRADKNSLRVLNLSGDSFQLESISGLLMPHLRIQYIHTLNIANNLIPDLKVLSERNERGENRFAELKTIKASKNVIQEAFFSIDTLTAVNLSGNTLTKLPSFSHKRQIRRLIFSRNRIDIATEGLGSIQELQGMLNLVHLDLSYNQISWKPSKFKECISSLSQLHIENVILACNPFTQYFKQYQFLTVCLLESLTEMDGFRVSAELRSDMSVSYDKMYRENKLDYQYFDMQVHQLQEANAPLDMKTDFDALVAMPPVEQAFDVMLSALNEAMEQPNLFNEHLNKFFFIVKGLFNMKWSKRIRLMGAPDDIKEVPEKEAHRNKAKICHFVDKVQAVMARYESTREDMIVSLTRLLASGNAKLAAVCAAILSETIEETPTLEYSMFHELRDRFAEGVVSVKEDGSDVYEWQRHNEHKDETPFGNGGSRNSIAETTAILQALTHFGPLRGNRCCNPRCAKLMRPFMSFICGPRSKEKGPRLPDTGSWIEYADFDAMPDDTAEVLEGADASFLDFVARSVVKKGWGGFVVEEHNGYFKIMYKEHSPKLLVAARVPCHGRVLHVRPVTPEPPDKPLPACPVFDNYSTGLAVLAIATADRDNAAECINKYQLHKVSLFDDSPHSNKVWLANNTSPVLIRTVTTWLHVQTNLLAATGEAKLTAAQLFLEHNLHKSVWQALQPRLTDNGVAMALGVLKTLPADTRELLSSSLVLICTMANPELGVQEPVVDFLVHHARFVYAQLLGVCSDTDTPEPLLFTTALEVVYVFLENDTMRPIFIEDTLAALHNSAVLLPYVKGPELEDGSPNVQFNNLHAYCVAHYGNGNESRSEDTQGGEAKSRLAPRISELTNTMMHRVLLGIVRLIQLFSSSADKDMVKVADLLNKRGREKMLLGPSSGLINCPDWDVKIQSLKCVELVTQAAPEALEKQEMSWLMRYLSPHGIGVGKQEDVLTEVLNLCIRLVENEFIAGERFRDNFAKQAIRVAFQILLVNSKRDVSSSVEEEASKVALSLKITTFLQACSAPRLSGNLRHYLREDAFTDMVKAVMVVEDKHTRRSCRAALMKTWSGREMTDVLLQLACTRWLSLRGVGRLRALERIAEVIWGTLDHFGDATTVTASFATESVLWPGQAAVEKERRRMDREEWDDWCVQQEAFVGSDGVSELLAFASKMFRQLVPSHFADACEKVNVMVMDAEQRVQAWYAKQNAVEDAHPASAFPALSLAAGASNMTNLANMTHLASNMTNMAQMPEAEESIHDKLTTHFVDRLGSINRMVMEAYHVSLSVFDHLTQRSSLVKLAEAFVQHFQDNQEVNKKIYDSDPSGWRHLLSNDRDDGVPDMLSHEGVLYTLEELTHRDVELKAVRQSFTDMDALYNACVLAHDRVKHCLVSPSSKGTKEYDKALVWADTVFQAGVHGPNRRVSKGLVEFIEDHGGEVIDPGLKDRAIVERRMFYKYGGDVRRVKDVSRLVIEYRTAALLSEAIQDLMKFTLFTAVKIKNRYRKPTGLGRRMVRVNVEVATVEGQVICTLILVVAEPTDNLDQARLDFHRKVREVVATDCGVQENSVVVADYVTYLINSRAIRSGDKVGIVWPNYIAAQVVGTEVHLPETSLQSRAQLFTIEREKGFGIVLIGDVVYLKSEATDKYIDSSLTGSVSCRFMDQRSEEANLAWRVEPLDQDEEDHGRINFISKISTRATSLFSTDLMSGEAIKASRNKIKRMLGRPLQSSHKVALRAQGSERFLAAELGGSSTRLRAVKVSWIAKGFNRRVRLQRHGNFRVFLNDETFKYMYGRAGHFEFDDDDSDPKEKCEHMLNEAMMRTGIHKSCARRCFLFPTVSFDVLSQKMVDKKLPEPDDTPLFFYMCRIGAILKTIYGLLSVPVHYRTKASLIDEFCGDPMASFEGTALTDMLSAALAAMSHTVEVSKPLKLDDVVLHAAWFPQKLLRVLSGILLNLPAESKNAFVQEADRNLSKAEVKKQKASEAAGVSDMQRLTCLSTIVDFIRQVFIGPLMERLSIVSHRPLDLREVALLRQLAIVFCHVCHRFNCIELRCSPPSSSADAEPSLVSAMDMLSSHRRAFAMSIEMRAKIFMEMTGFQMFHVLVHGLLYGIHREAMNYSNPTTEGQTTVEVDRTHLKLATSLVNHSLQALAQGMSLVRAGDPIDYDVCEVISSALTTSTQSMPRARIEELMRLRDLSSFVQAAEAHIGTGICNNIVEPRTHQLRGEAHGERVIFSAVVYMGWLSAQQAPELKKRFLVVTSRLALLIFDVPPELGDQHEESITPAMLTLNREPCNAYRIDRLILSPKFRQVIIFWWDYCDELTNTNREVVIFRSPAQRNKFREIGLMVQPFSKPRVAVDGKLPPRPKHVQKNDRGMIEAPVTINAMLGVQYFVKRLRPRLEAKLATVSFCMNRGEMEALVLTNDMIASFSAGELFKSAFCNAEDEEFYARFRWEGPDFLDINDSDSDSEELEVMEVSGPAFSSINNVLSGRNVNPWTLDTLKGVWFLAVNMIEGVHSPQMKLEFSNPKSVETFVFLSDSDRQRFRQKLAAVMAMQSKTLSFVPTKAENLEEANKKLKEQSKHDANRLKEIAKLRRDLRGAEPQKNEK